MRCVAVVLASLALAAAPRGASGGQVARRAGLYVTAAAAPLPLTTSHIEVAIRGPLASATITQTFRNDADHVVEATYIFPLPADAAVSAMAIDVAGHRVHAQIARRAEAAQRYEDAIAAGLGAGLLEEERADVFTQTVSAIPAHGTVTVTLRFDTVARRGNGAWELVLPLVVAPRFVPGSASGRATTGTGRTPDTDRAPDASRVTPGGAPDAGGPVEVTLEFADDVDDVQSPTHELHGAGRSFTLVDPRGDHDAVVRWRTRDAARGWIEDDGDTLYAAVVVATPPPPPRGHQLHVLLVIDRAVTTRGDGDAVLHPVARALLAAADAHDRVALAGVTNAPEREPVVARTALDDAWGAPGGARDLTAELAALRPAGAAVVLASDGLVADDRAAVAAAKRLGVRVHVIGVGPAPNRGLLAAIARATGGTLRFAIAGDDLGALARAVLADIATPPSPVAVTWGALHAGQVEPATLTLGADQGVLVVAQLAGMQKAAPAQDAHAFHARAAGDIFALATIAVPHAPEGATTPRGPLARWWARARLDELVAAGDRAAIAAHALAWGLVSPETSMLAVSDQVIEQGGVKHTIAVPVSAPAGMRWQEVRHALEKAQANKNAEVKPAERTADVHGHRAQTGADEKQEKDSDRRDTGKRGEADDIAGNRKRTAAPPPAPSTPPSAPTVPVPGSVSPDATEVIEVAPAAPPVEPAERTTADAEEEVRAQGVESSQTTIGRGPTLSLSLGGGLAITAGHADAAAAARARIAWGRPFAFGVEGTVWDVGYLNVEGELLATLERLHVRPWLALGGGLGVHVGDGVGPAGALQLRVPMPRGRLSWLLRYDGALLLDNATAHGQHVLTLGVQASW
jgi:Ca-activated chloride channel family protein